MIETKIWAHRGASGYAPENSLESFSLAKDMKADGIELDVQLTKDGEIVVIHDETIDRVSNGSGNVKDYTLKELKTFNINKYNNEYGFVSIPTLSEVYRLLKDTDMIINVELKTGVIFYKGLEEKLLDLEIKMGVEERVIYSSFNHYSIMKLKELNSNARLGILYTDSFINVPEYAKSIGVGAIHPQFNNLDKEFLKASRENRLKVNVWNVRDYDIEYCLREKVNAIITNYPDRTRKLINEYNLGEKGAEKIICTQAYNVEENK